MSARGPGPLNLRRWVGWGVKKAGKIVNDKVQNSGSMHKDYKMKDTA